MDDRVRVGECRRKVIAPSERSHLIRQLTETPLKRRAYLPVCPRNSYRARPPALDRVIIVEHCVHDN